MRYSVLPPWSRQYVAYCRARSAEYSARMLPPQPHVSLPIPQNFTRHGSSRPLALRSRTIGLSPSRVRYSTQSLISCTVPEPTLPLMYGSAPSSSHRAMNSWVPKWLFSSTLPQWVLTMRGR